jgi:hypothetical protein
MLIEGPLDIGIADTSTGGRELQINFTPEFKSLKLTDQSDSMHEFIHYLKTEIDILEEHDPNRQGMLMILQISEELLPHIEANEVPLEETIVVNIAADNPFGSIEIQSN